MATIFTAVQDSGSERVWLRRPLPQNPDDKLTATVVSLIHEAGQPYFDWFFRGPEAARAVLDDWLARPSSEVSASRVSLVHARGAPPAGLFIGLNGADLQACRKSDLLTVLGQTRSSAERKTLVERISQTNDLFAPVDVHDYYLSKMAVVRECRGSGVARRVLDEFLDEGTAQGYRRFSLDVAADNAPAIRVYASAGFRVQETRERAGMRYLRMTLNRLALLLLPTLSQLEVFPVS